MALTTEQLALITSAVVATAGALSPVIAKVLDRSMLHDAKAAEWRAEWWARRRAIYERVISEGTSMTQRVWAAGDSDDVEAVKRARNDLVETCGRELRPEINAYASSRCAKALGRLIEAAKSQPGDTAKTIEARVDKAYADLCVQLRSELREGPRRAHV